MAANSELPKNFDANPLFLEVMAEALAIQDRFSAEPVYAKTGKGSLKSAGVEELKQIKLLNRKWVEDPAR